MELLHDAIATDSATAETYVLIGDIHQAAHDPKAALLAYERALNEKCKNKSEKVLWKATSAALESSNFKKAQQYIKKIVEGNPENFEASDIMKRLEASIA